MLDLSFRVAEFLRGTLFIQSGGNLIAAILANPAIIKAYWPAFPVTASVPLLGPDGGTMAKIHWSPKRMGTFPAATVPGTQYDVDFMVRNFRRFADGGGWGWAVFDYDAASDMFTPGTLAGKPLQGATPRAGSRATRW
jgi:hypothetical protein